jgi:hypothetical protein
MVIQLETLHNIERDRNLLSSGELVGIWKETGK